MQGRRWTITKAPVAVGESGVKFQTPRESETMKFRLLDDDGEVYFYGVMIPTNEEIIFAPLDEFGLDYGCTSIEVFENGKWEMV